MTQEEEVTCEAVIKGKAMRALIDTRATVSLIREDQYKNFEIVGLVRSPDIEISQADGKTMSIVGMVRLL